MNELELIQSLIDMLGQMPDRDEEKLDAVRRRAQMIMRSIFGGSSQYITDLTRIRFRPSVLGKHVPDSSYHRAWNSGKGQMLNLFNTMLEELQLTGSTEESHNRNDNSTKLNSIMHLGDMGDKARTGIALIERQLVELSTIHNRSSQDGDYDSAKGRLRRWKERTANLLSENVSQEEADKLLEIHRLVASGDSMFDFVEESRMYQGYLVPLKEELEAHPEDILVPPKEINTENVVMESNLQTESRTIFIVHGHDEANTLRLEKLLGDRWNLEPIVLRDRPGKGRTLIEKFEQEAKQSAYAFVLFTPDDLIEVPQSEESYTQARPNVIFELGWFYGRLGRDRVCILFKDGTKIPSDLDGINRIEYSESVEEKILDIEKELKAAGLLDK